MNFLRRNAFLLLVTLSLGFITTSCDKDEDGDSDIGTRCYECEDTNNNQSDVICEDNYQNFVNQYNIQNPSNFEAFIDDVDALPGITCELELF